MTIQRSSFAVGAALLGVIATSFGCGGSGAGNGYGDPPPQALPVLEVRPTDATTYQEFTASLEGARNIEIRPQVEGYLDKVLMDEGAFVHRGQPLFKINDEVYAAQLNNARANLEAAKAAQESAQINVDKLAPLVQNNVVSDVQLKTAQAALDAAKANVAQAQAMVRNASINVGFTTVYAPIDGYIGRIPYKLGSLVGTSDAQPLTILSEVSDMYAYFSMSEQDFITFKEKVPGATIADKLTHLPPVELILADNSIYPLKGKVETVEGQFDRGVGAIPFRATFPNPGGLLRTGNTGKVRIGQALDSVMVVPQESTFELQDKVFVFAVGDSDKVASVPIRVTGTSGNYYLVSGGLTPGVKIVYIGLDRLRDGMKIIPEAMSLDSLIKARPL